MTITARPTEYAGTKFRSTSERVVAESLDRAGLPIVRPDGEADTDEDEDD